MSVVTFAGTPAQLGAAHGERFGAEIREYLADRLGLAAGGTWSGGVRLDAATVLRVADELLPAHAEYAPELVEETEALARAAGITPGEALLVSGFTDVVDVLRRMGDPGLYDECTAMLVRDGDGALLGQTWDMHETAGRYVRLLRLEPRDGPAALVFTTTGCLGQMGLNAAGVGIGITNLSAGDGRVGVTWPFVVRRALAQRTLRDALACVTEAPLAGGHNYLLVGPGGEAYAVEAMPEGAHVERLDGRPVIRTNHCLDAANQAREADRTEELQASSRARLALAGELLGDDPQADAARLRDITAQAPVICQSPAPPDDVATVGAIVADPERGELHVATGSPATHDYGVFRLRGSNP